MTPSDPAELERVVGRALDALPPPRAPRALLPRVMAQVQAHSAGMRAQAPRFAWSPMAQAALVVVSVSVLTLAWWAWPFAAYALDLMPEPVRQVSRQADAVASTASDLMHVGSLVWQAVVGPIVKGLFMVTAVLCTACALIAAALGRIALGGAHQS